MHSFEEALSELSIFQHPHPPLTRTEKWRLGLLGNCKHGMTFPHEIDTGRKDWHGKPIKLTCPGPPEQKPGNYL